jgi:hypothetical protein
MDWRSINAFIDRERAYEQQRLDREMERERMNREDSARRRAEQFPSYALPLSVYSYYPGVCPYHGCGGYGGGRPQPVNTFAPLSQRGIRTAVDLYRESVYNSAARRANMP